MPSKSKRFNPRKGLCFRTKSLMDRIYQITKDFREKKIHYNIPMIMNVLGYKENEISYKEGKKIKHQIINVFNAGREIAKQILKAMRMVFRDDKGELNHKFIDFEGKTLTREQAEKQFEKLLDDHKIPYEYYDSIGKTFVPTFSFVVREDINQARLIKKTLSTETVLEDMILTNDKIQITNKSAIESLSYVRDTHQKYLIDGLSPKESKKNIWEKKIKKSK